MATTGKLELYGLAAYLEEIARAGKDIDAAAAQALEAGAKPILAEMKKRVPKDTHNLESHLEVDGPHRTGSFSFVEIGLVNADKETAIYGNVQEFGSSSVTAQPYVRPAFRTKKSAAMKAMKATLESDGWI